MQRSRNRRRRQRQRVDTGAVLLETLFMHDAETLFFVDNDQAEVGECNVLLQQAMRPDDDIDLALGQRAQDLLLLRFVFESRQLFDANRKTRKSGAERAKVLL